MENGHEYVDLGLPSGTLWATCNVGAETPESFGDYFAWGETTTYTTYDFSTYKYYEVSHKAMTKYCISSSDDMVDNKTELEDEDDVAVLSWGGNWQMPTKAMQDELRDHCYWVWTESYNGKKVNGYIVYKAKRDKDKGVMIKSGKRSSRKYNVANDVHIFLPSAGYLYGSNLEFKGVYGYYWSRSRTAFGSHYACCPSLNSTFVDWFDLCLRYIGHSVRPIVPIR